MRVRCPLVPLQIETLVSAKVISEIWSGRWHSVEALVSENHTTHQGHWARLFQSGGRKSLSLPCDLYSLLGDSFACQSKHFTILIQWVWTRFGMQKILENSRPIQYVQNMFFFFLR